MSSAQPIESSTPTGGSELQLAKAFDNKTSILQYVVLLISRSDPSCLQFPSELGKVSLASRMQMESLLAERNELHNGLQGCCSIALELKSSGDHGIGTGAVAGSDRDRPSAGETGDMEGFLETAKQTMETLDRAVQSMQTQFASVLEYFGEDKGMATQDFFSTLDKFIQVLVMS